MKKVFLKNTVQVALGIGLTLAVVASLTGCQSTSTDRIKFSEVHDSEAPQDSALETMKFGKDDLVIVTFAGSEDMQPHEERIKEDGTITLQHIGSITAAGKTTGELQREIHDAFVPSYYKRLTVTVKTDRLLYYVQGYVRQSGRQEYRGSTTVLKAIASAGDFNEFADRKNVVLTRKDGTRIIVNCIKAAKDSSLDLLVFPGDKIEVTLRRPFSAW
jgi:polysaccharide export outer membrane protein